MTTRSVNDLRLAAILVKSIETEDEEMSLELVRLAERIDAVAMWLDGEATAEFRLSRAGIVVPSRSA